jgi:hypothetical protein
MKRRELLLLRTTSVRKMEKELTYRSVFPVLESCDKLRCRNTQDEVGGKLFLKCVASCNPQGKFFRGTIFLSRSANIHSCFCVNRLAFRLLQKNPRVLTFFGLSGARSSRSHGEGSRDRDDWDTGDNNGFRSLPAPSSLGASRFALHVTMMLDLLHHALGPDVESLDEVLFDLGRRHAALGVGDPGLFSVMLSCLVEVVDELVGLSEEARRAWAVVSDALVTSLSTAAQATDSERSAEAGYWCPSLR